MSSKEIITLQFGNYSNHVGTHYWNFHYKRMLEKFRQDEEKPNYIGKLFRESDSSRSQFVPRSICFDIKTKLQSLKQDGTFNGDERTLDEVNNENLVMYAEPSIEKNDFVKQVLTGDIDSGKKVNYDFDGEVKTWTDFMMYELHDHSIQLLNDTYKDGEDFSFFGIGQQEFDILQDNFEEKLHFWSEECDFMEGFQLFGDLHNGYCGLQANVLQFLADEYDKKAKLNFLNWSLPKDGFTEKNKVYQYLNVALSLQSMKENSSLTVFQSAQKELFCKEPENIQFPYIDYRSDLEYHTSALLAAAIDSSTIPLYEINSNLNLSELCYHVSHGRWKLAGTSFGIPFDRADDPSTTLFDLFLSKKRLHGEIVTNLFPNLKASYVKPNSQLIVLQNLPSDMVCPRNIDSKVLQSLGLNRNVFNRNPYSVLEFFSEKYYPCEDTITKLFYSHETMKAGLPFPSIVKQGLENVKDSTGITTISSLYSSPCFYELIAEVTLGVKRMNLNKFHVVQEFGLDRDMVNELLEDLIQIAQTYNHDRAFHELEE